MVGVTTATAAIRPFMRVSGGALPQDINWAVKSEYIGVLVDLSQMQSPSAGREEAIALVKSAACQVKAIN